MFDFIPDKYYTPVFFNIILLFTLFEIINISSNGITFNKSKSSSKPIILYLFVLLYMGLRPVSDVFNDMPGYNYTFLQCLQLFADFQD